MYSLKNALFVIRIIHLALMVGPILFSIVVGFLISDLDDSYIGIDVLNYLSPAYFFIVLALHPMIFRTILRQNNLETKTLQQKIASFQVAHIIRIALMESCALLAAIVALVNGEAWHLITVGLTVALMFTKVPTPFLLESELGLSLEEKEQLK